MKQNKWFAVAAAALHLVSLPSFDVEFVAAMLALAAACMAYEE